MKTLEVPINVPSVSFVTKSRSKEEYRGRIAFVAHRIEKNDGQGRVNYEIVKAALASGFHVTLIATHCAPEIITHERARFVSIGKDRLPTNLFRNLFFAFSSANWLRKHRDEFDLIQTNGFVTWEPTDIAVAHFVHTAWAKNPYYPFRGVKPYALYQRLFTSLNARWEKPTFLRAKYVVAVSSLVGCELERLGVPDGRIKIIPNGVDTDQFHPGAPERETFGLPTNVPLALFVGDIRTKRKNLETILRALQRVPGVFLAVAGDATNSPYPRLARELKVEERVLFLGKIKQVAELMRSADLFVFPSRYDPFGLVALEAMASGIPVIASAKSGASDIVGDGGVVLTDPDDVNLWADQIEQLLQSPEVRRRMALAARQRALEMQWSEMTTSYIALYDSFLQPAPQREAK